MSAVEESGTRATYAYGPTGMREIKQLVSSAGTTTVTDAWVGMGLMAERVVTPTSTTEYRYVYGPDSLPVELLVKKGSGAWVSYAIHCDAGGSVTGISDEDGNTVARYAYDPWGNPIEDATHATDALVAAQPLRYRGYYWDAETAHYYLPARYYDPALGRFLSVDPAPPSAGEPMSLNRYVYCVDDPVNLLDRDGREPHGLGMCDGYTEDGYNYGRLPGQGSMKDANEEAPRIAQEARRRRERRERAIAARRRAREAILRWLADNVDGNNSMDLNLLATPIPTGTPGLGIGVTGGAVTNQTVENGQIAVRTMPYSGVAISARGAAGSSAMFGPMNATPGARYVEFSGGWGKRGGAVGWRVDGDPHSEGIYWQTGPSKGFSASWYMVGWEPIDWTAQ